MYLNKMGTKRQVAPGSASFNQPYCSLDHIKTNNKSSNETDGTDATTHSHSRSLSPTPHSVTQNSTSVPDKKTGRNKVRFAFSNISVIQCNLHKAKTAWDAIANNFNKTINPIFLTTEPYHDSNRAIPRVHKDLTHYYYSQGTAGPRSCISVHKSLNNSCWELKQFSSKDCMAIKININDKKVILASIYMDIEDESFPPKSLIELEKYAKQIDVTLIIGSDANSHHVLWGDKKQDKRGEVLLEYLYSCDLSWANRGSKPTFVNSRGHSSVIDLTLTNNKGSDLINSWRVSDLISNSDHNYITFNINVESKSTNITYNPTKTNWEKFEDFVCNSSRCEYIKKLEIKNEEDMDIAAQELITLINEAMIASCPSTYITSTFKRPPWMTREVDEARANIRHRLKRVKKSKTRNNWNTYHSELKDYKKLFKKAKSDSWKEFCKNTESTSDIARVHNILKVTGSKPTKLDTIYKSKNTKTLTDSPNETLDVMIKHHFTGVSADAPQDVNQQVNKIKPPNELIKKIINED